MSHIEQRPTPYRLWGWDGQAYELKYEGNNWGALVLLLELEERTGAPLVVCDGLNEEIARSNSA